MGRPMFCLSLSRGSGPYDFVSYARITAGLPAVPELRLHADPTSGRDGRRKSDCAGPDSGAPSLADPSASSSPGQQQQNQHQDPQLHKSASSSRGSHDKDSERTPGSSHLPPPSSPPIFPFASQAEEGGGDQDRCNSHEHTLATEGGLSGPTTSSEAETTPGVHERWSALRGDPEGLRAVVDALALRLVGYGGGGGGGEGRGSHLAGGVSGEATEHCKDGGCGRRDDNPVETAFAVEEVTRVSFFLWWYWNARDCVKYLAQKYESRATKPPPPPPKPHRSFRN